MAKENKSLVIVESPSKAKTINKFLGKDFKVLASVGHIIDLPKSRFGVNIEDGFKPQYIRIRGKEKIINQLKKEARIRAPGEHRAAWDVEYLVQLYQLASQS